MILLAILILVLSIFFFKCVGFLNINFLNFTKKSTDFDTKKSTGSDTKNNIRNCMNKKDDDDDLNRVFETFDKDRDGYITREELKDSLNKIGILVLPKEVEDMVDTLDANKDGLIDVNEFKKLYEMIKGIEDHNEEVDVEGEIIMKEAFDVFDKDKDGLISVEELEMVLTSLGLKQGGKIEEDECKEMINKVDVDGDGMVNFHEFKIMMSSHGASTSLALAS
ncbi:hypothetical protein RND81_06G147200 [Saponaria officinalis]|uniref:EF-hand domain-containing protein n=1 Tax=Saponaria officinalis TaxID=3572 RepID=A0AAW1KBE4_SAPOF